MLQFPVLEAMKCWLLAVGTDWERPGNEAKQIPCIPLSLLAGIATIRTVCINSI